MGPGFNFRCGKHKERNNMNNLKICPVCSGPFQKTIGLAFHVEEIHPEY